MKNNLILNRGIKNSSKKLIKKITSICLVSTLGCGQTLSTAQELPPAYCNETQVYNSSVSNDDAEIMKVLREELDGWEGYTRGFLSMLSDNEIRCLYVYALSQN